MRPHHLIGAHHVGSATVKDLMDVFSQMALRTQREAIVQICIDDDLFDLWDVQIVHSEPQEKSELAVYIRATKKPLA